MGFLTFDPSQLLALLPEILLALLAFAILAADLATPEEKKRSLGIVATVGLLIVAAVSILWRGPGGEVFGGMLRDDPVALVFRVLFMIAGTLAILLSMDFKGLRQGGEYYSLLIFAVMGMGLMAAANNLVMVYVALELTDIALYVLAGFLRDDSASTEAGIKYFLFGACASAIMLYGMSLMYGFTGALDLPEIGEALQETSALPAMIGLVLMLVGLGFKVAAVPMQFWVPDVYQGAPTPITAFISVASKAAGFAVLARVLTFVFPAVQGEWMALVMTISLFTMTVGNLFAIPQHNIKRLLGYSGIAQAGYLLIGVTASSKHGLAAAIFYLIVYTLTNIAAFATVILVSNRINSDEIADYAALSRRSPYLALALLAALLSLAGIPPFGGFVGKLFLFAAGIGSGLVWLVIAGVLNVILGLYYYLSVAKVMYVTRSEHEDEPIPVTAAIKGVLVVTTTGVLLLGVVATPFYNMVLDAVASWF